MALPYEQIQGFVLRGYSHPRARHFMINMPDAAAGKRFLAAVTPMISTAVEWKGGKPATLLQIGLTKDGLSKLGIDINNAGLSLEFVQGAVVRGFSCQSNDYNLGDSGDSAPDHWILELGTGRVHAILSLYALDPQSRDTATGSLITMMATAGVSSLGTQDSDDILGDSRVHFNYHDGISQPNIEGSPRDPDDGQPVVKTGEFVLGYNAEGQVFRAGPTFDPANGSYSAFRILRQDVDAFEAYLNWAASQYDLPQEVIKAKFCGRWADGTPLVLSPEKAIDQPVNDFFYQKAPPDPPDFPARSCPISSHIRRSQRRDEDSQQHRILRRAFPYGPPYSPGDGKERGLTGHFICSSLQQQYEFIISQWVNGAGVDPSAYDPLIGAIDANHPPQFRMYWKGVKTKLEKYGRFTTTRGGAYCYLPSIAGLQNLAK